MSPPNDRDAHHSGARPQGVIAQETRISIDDQNIASRKWDIEVRLPEQATSEMRGHWAIELGVETCRGDRCGIAMIMRGAVDTQRCIALRQVAPQLPEKRDPIAWKNWLNNVNCQRVTSPLTS
jgi:hypothetical protein